MLKCSVSSISSTAIFPAAVPHIMFIKCLTPFWSILWTWWRGSRLQACSDGHSPHPSSQCRPETTSHSPPCTTKGLRSLPGERHRWASKIIRLCLVVMDGTAITKMWKRLAFLSWGKFCTASPGKRRLLLSGIRCRASWRWPVVELWPGCTLCHWWFSLLLPAANLAA